MSILTQGLRWICRNALDACLPDSCVLCGSDSAEVLCPECHRDLPSLPVDCCPRCAQQSHEDSLCGACTARPPYFDGTLALYRYEFPLDRLVHAFKYGGQLALGRWFGIQLAASLVGRDFDRVVSMPLHPARLRERGFNQSGEIARVVARRLGVPLDVESCRRTRLAPPQAGLPLQEREANVRGIFECATDLSGQRILLVDDVMTSGATLNECARTLRLHGAVAIDTAIIARALRN